MGNLLLIRPANDPVALELSSWAAALKSVSTIHSITTDLASAAATRAAVDAGLPAHDAILFFGHGTPTKLRAATVNLVDATNVGLAAQKAVIAVACSSADILGTTAISQGVIAYLGFTKKLLWVTGDPDTQFQPAFSAGIEKFMNGATIDDAAVEIRSKLQSVVDYYHSGAGRSSPNNVLGFLTASWDLTYLAGHGNGNHHL